jgi:exosome complex exonuclease DIS3/RRP44
MLLYRRHLPPPRTNFEKLQDILLKTKGMKLDTTSSGALAASLDQCVVRGCLSLCPFVILEELIHSFKTGSSRTCVQHPSSHHGYSLYAFCGIFLLRQCSVGKDTFGHYGLASFIYTHFTSPIRRYAGMLL